MTTPSPWFHHWKDVRQGLCAALDKLSDEQLAFVPREGLWSLGTTAAHIASAEEGWFRYVVQRELGGWPDYAASDYATVERLKALLARVHDRTTAYLETLDEDGEVLMSMRTWIWVRSGDQRGCVGCHEDKKMGPENRATQALVRARPTMMMGPRQGPEESE